MPPCGGTGTIITSPCAVNKSQRFPVLSGIFRSRSTADNSFGDASGLPHFRSKLGKTGKSIRDDSLDSCHGVSLTLG
jgi:hypothetical protein